MGLSFAGMFSQRYTVADLRAPRAQSAKNGGRSLRSEREDVVRAHDRETRAVFDEIVAGNEKSMAGSGRGAWRQDRGVRPDGRQFSLPMVQWPMRIMKVLVGTLAETEAMSWRAGKIKPTPMQEEPMADVQKWIEELRAGKVVDGLFEELRRSSAGAAVELRMKAHRHAAMATVWCK